MTENEAIERIIRSACSSGKCYDACLYGEGNCEYDGWIPVDRELPPNANHKGALCPRYQVMTKYGVTEGWYNPNYESWFCLLWFMNKKFTKGYIDFERGDVPKVVQIEKGIDIVLAWRPLPEPYRPERNNEE